MSSLKPRYFFKVFFPDQSTDSLRIPPAFWGHIMAESGKRVALRGPSGSIWKTRLVKDSEGFVFGDGWKEFVENQALVMGDFLIFRYKGNSRFEVLVFDKTACEKKEAFLARPSVDNEIEVSEDSEEPEEEVSMGDEDDDEEENKPLVHFARRRFNGSLKRESVINDLLGTSDPSLKKKKKKKKYAQFDMDESNSSRSKAYPTNSGDLLTPKQEWDAYSPSSSSKSNRDAPIDMNGEIMHRKSAFSSRCHTINKTTMFRYQNGQVSKFSPQSTKESTTKKSSKSLDLAKSDESIQPRGLSKFSPQSTKESAAKKSSKSLDLMKYDESIQPRGSIYRGGSLMSQRRAVTEEEAEQTLQRAMSFKSEHPFAVAIMQDSYVYTSFFMSIPTWFAKEYLPKENTVLTVWDPTDKPWQITYICYGSHGALSGGWGKFSFVNNLEKYDVCVFELIKMNHLKVHIYRVVEEITPLIRRRHATNKFLCANKFE